MKTDIDTQQTGSTRLLRLLKKKARQKTRRSIFESAFFLIAGAILLYANAFWNTMNMYGDAWKQADGAKYQCYALAFWQGANMLRIVPKVHCASITSLASAAPFHILPSEYPFLALIPFSIPLIAPLNLYLFAFALLMLLVAGVIYFVLRRFASIGAACAFVLYLVVGCLVTAPGRYDLVPAALTLIALVCAERAKWKWAFALLALATLLKFYPVVLLPPFFIAQQMQESDRRWFAWRRYVPIGIFAVLCVVVMGASFLLSVPGTLGPLDYFAYRPIQVESLAASVVRVISMIRGYRLEYAFSFGSRNVLSPISPIVSIGDTIMLVLGFLYVYWLQWRKKIALSMAVLLTLLIMILLGKVFSAQYLIWVAPFIAYVGKWNWKWIIGWGSISLVTTLIYPFLYNRAAFWFEPYLPELYNTVLVRNLLLLGFSCVLLYLAARNRPGSVVE